MTNSDKFSNFTYYETLYRMNEILMKQRDNTTELCILCCFMSSSDAGALCTYDCASCIKNWLKQDYEECAEPYLTAMDSSTGCEKNIPIPIDS